MAIEPLSTSGQQTATGLHWVRLEIDRSLRNVRRQLEEYLESESPEDHKPLLNAIEELRQVRGIFSLVGCYGAAALAGEMVQVLDDLNGDALENPSAAYDALSGASLQISDYMELLVGGEFDRLIVLQPIINELRLVRSQPLITEPELFAIQIQLQGIQVLPPVRSSSKRQSLSREMLEVFQQNFLSWYRGRDRAAALKVINRLAEQVSYSVNSFALRSLWWVLTLLTESISEESDSSVDLKRLLGRAVMQLRILIEQGEAVAETQLGNLGGQLAYHLALAPHPSSRARADGEIDVLRHMVLSTDDLELVRNRLRLPNASVLDQVHQEFRRDLQQVKDAIDLLVRTGGRIGADVDLQRERLEKLGSTLGLLGLRSLQTVLANQARALGDLTPDSAGWMEIATALLRVENSLEEGLFRAQSRMDFDELFLLPDLSTSEAGEYVPSRRDLNEAVSALVREALVNFAQIKATIVECLDSSDTEQVGSVSVLLGEVAAGLEIIDQITPAHLIRTLEQYTRSDQFSRIRLDLAHTDVLAEAVAAAELYLEALQKGLPQLEGFVEQFTSAVDRLDQLAGLPGISEGATGSALMDTDTRMFPAPVSEALAGGPDQADSTSVETPTAREPAADKVAEADSEILAVFAEEVEEVLGNLRRDLTELRRAPQSGDLLASVRRAFHTLKGSGRMVGADSIGSLGLAVEQVFNRCLDNNLTAPAKAVEIAEEAVDQIDILLTGFKEGQVGSSSSVSDFIARAEAVRSSIDTSEADIYSVFRDDARERLSFIGRWVDSATAQGITPVAVEAEILRAFHTLAGSAGIIGLDSVQRIFTAVEKRLSFLQKAGKGIGADELIFFSELVASLKNHIGDSETAEIEKDALENWLSRVDVLEEAAPFVESKDEEGDDRETDSILSAPDESLLAALDTLQEVQAEVRRWCQSESHLTGETALKGLRDLAYSDAVDGFPELIEASNALAQRLSQLTEAPTQTLAAALEDVFESFYRLLDERHEGWKSSSWAQLLDQIAGLPIKVPARNDTHVQLRSEPASDSNVPGDAGPDRELLAIFIDEAKELLVEFKASLVRLEDGDVSVGRELQRVLHTFKGSAGVVGFEEFGVLCERYEQSIASLTNEDDSQLVSLAPGLAEFSGRLELLIWEASDILGDKSFAADEQIQEEPRTVPLVPFDADGEENEFPATDVDQDAKAVALADSEAAVEGSRHDADGSLGSERSSDDVNPAESRFADGRFHGEGELDLELVSLFSEEASELIEHIDSAFARWQSDQGLTNLQEVMRALHTLKGGARSAGLVEFGNATHAFESQLEQVVNTNGFPDTSTLASLQAGIDKLHDLHDGLGAYQASESVLPPTPSSVDGAGSSPWRGDLFWVPEDEQAGDARLSREYARVSVDELNTMLNQAGEISIYRSRLEQTNNNLLSYLIEIKRTIERIRDQLRMLDMETEAQITARGLNASVSDADRYGVEFDPLEMDRYTRMQELSRALAEAVNDMASISSLIDRAAVDGNAILQDQAQLTTGVHRGLMDALTVPFGRQQSRFERIVRQTSLEYGKQVDLHFQGSDTEIDRNILERVTGSIEHLLRNAVIHGVESTEARQKGGKPDAGRIEIFLSRQAEEFVVDVRDDGRGLDFSAIRQRAVKRGFLDESASISDNELARFIFEPGFSTASELTQAAGRGLGLDAVSSAIRQLGGTLELRSEVGRGTRFLIRLPLTLAITQALVVEVGREFYALPISGVLGVTRVSSDNLLRRLESDEAVVYGGENHVLRYLGDYLDLPRPATKGSRSRSVIIARAGEPVTGDDRRPALLVDELIGRRELIAKPIGQQLSMITGVAGASILADGQPVLLLDMPSLLVEQRRQERSVSASTPLVESQLVLVVDDSITMRRVAQRVLERAGLRVITARDGLDAMAILQSETPTAVLLDIEMPRADGFEVAEFMRNTERLSQVPIIMITSRSGEKHRSRAQTLRVDRYLIKPYQEDQLLAEVQSLCVKENG